MMPGEVWTGVQAMGEERSSAITGMSSDLASPSVTRPALARSLVQRAGTQRGMTIVVQGLAGMGKTWFLRELTHRARDAGRWEVSFVSADEVEAHVPYGFLERLLAGWGMAAELEDLLVDDQPAQPVVVGRELVRRQRRGGRSEHLTVIDDAQWIDDESVRVLRYALPRLTSRGLVAAIGVRTPHASDSFGAHLEDVATDNPLAQLVAIDPLTVAQIHAFAAERLGTTISPRSTEKLHRATGGSFLHVATVLDHLTPTEVSQLHLAWDIPLRGITAADNPLLADYRGLSAAARATTDIVCLARHQITRRDLARTAERLGEPVQVDEAIGAGVLIESGFGSAVAPNHALVAHAVREVLPPDRTRAVCRALAGVTEGYASIQFRLTAADSLDDELLAQVRRYVGTATEERAFDGVNAVLRGALGLVADHDDEVRDELLIMLGLANLRNKSSYLLLDLMEQYERLPPSMLGELLAIVLAAHHPETPFPQERVLALLQQPASSPDELTIQAYLSFLLAIMTMRTADHSMLPMLLADAQRRFAEAPSDPAELEDQRLAWMVDPDGHRAVLACFEVVRLHRGYRMAETAAAIPPLRARVEQLPDTGLKADALTTLAGAAAHTGDIVLARTLAEEAVGLLDHVAKPWTAGTTRLVLADCMLQQGELEAVADLISVMTDVSYDAVDLEVRPMCAALSAIVAAHQGRPARELARRAEALHQFSWEGFGPDLAVLAGCEIARAEGDPHGVLAAIDAAPVDTMINTGRGFLTHRAHALMDLGRWDEAAELVATLEEWRGTRWLENWGTLAWLQARLARADGRTAEADRRFRDAAGHTAFPVPYALTLVDHADLLASEGRVADARTRLREAQRVLTRIGAVAHLSRVEDALAALADADRSQLHRVLAELTTREREVVGYLADGRSNQQIADSLVVSVATVRFHVSNVLRKLQITSRAEVGRVVRGASPDGGGLLHP